MNIEPQPDGCWYWTGHLNPDGYGPHRRAYRLHVGPIPAGYHLDHLCGVRHCVNPAHLEPVTPRVNSQRAAEVRRANPKPRRVYECIGSEDIMLEDD